MCVLCAVTRGLTKLLGERKSNPGCPVVVSKYDHKCFTLISSHGGAYFSSPEHGLDLVTCSGQIDYEASDSV